MSEQFRKGIIEKYGKDCENFHIMKCDKVENILETAFKQIEYCIAECPNNEICLRQVTSVVLRNVGKKIKDVEEHKIDDGRGVGYENGNE